MKNIIIIKEFIFCLGVLYPVLNIAQIHPDSLELVNLYNAVCNEGCTLNWDFTQPIETWEGVYVSGNTDRVFRLDISYKGLSGELSQIYLPYLIFLYADNNNLSGKIPDISGNLYLDYIRFGNNNFTGCFPSYLSIFCNQNIIVGFDNNPGLPNNGDFDAFCDNGVGACGFVTQSDSLELINFYNQVCNQGCTIQWDFSQSVDSWEGISVRNNHVAEINIIDKGISGNLIDINLPELTKLNLEGGSMNGGLLDFTYLTKLEVLILERQNITGNIPDFTHLPNLEELILDRTNLDREIPNFSNLPSLKVMNFRYNNLSGEIPDFNYLPNLEELILSNNSLSGNIPDFQNLPNLQLLSILANRLIGQIPDFSNLPNLATINAYSNDLNGSLPDFSNLPNLSGLYIHSNEFSGSIPNFSNLPNLQKLWLHYNNFTGEIPVFNNLPLLRYLKINNNKLSGEVPNFISSGLFESDIRNNLFSFDDIHTNFDNNLMLWEFNYSPQKYGTVQSHIVDFGDTISMGLMPFMNGNNTHVSYQWQKFDNNITGILDSIYHLYDLNFNDIGIYNLYMTDSVRVPGLEITSNPIYITVPGYDLYGQPITYNQIMVQFDTDYDKQSYENEHLYPNAGWVQDSCSCNRGLYLWQFPSDTLALQVLLDINTKTENQDGKTDVDGGPNNIFNLGVSNNSGTAWSWTSDYTGATYQDSVKVFMLDSGLDEGNWNASPYLLPDAPKDSCYNITASGYDYTDSLVTFTTDYIDSLGHGTFGFRSVVEGLSDYMDIQSIPLKVFDENGQGTLFKFVCALYHAIDHDADVINISAGYRGQPSEILAEAMQLAQQKGIFIVTATGNDGVNIDSIPQFPAYFSGITYEREIDDVIHDIPYDNVISVASINAQDSLSIFSNYGDNNATLAAYGENMSGYGVGGVGVVSSGTSMSTFYVTRELSAEIAKDKNRSLQQIWSDFETNKLVNNPPTYGLTKTGKRLDIQIFNTCLPNLQPIGDIEDGIYQAGQIIDSDGTIPTGSDVQFKAGDMIILQPGFQIEPQSEFSGEIEDCDDNQ